MLHYRISFIYSRLRDHLSDDRVSMKLRTRFGGHTGNLVFSTGSPLCQCLFLRLRGLIKGYLQRCLQH